MSKFRSDFKEGATKALAGCFIQILVLVILGIIALVGLGYALQNAE